MFFRIVKVNNYLSFAGLHLFLQTQLPIQEIEGFLEGKYGENASVEDLIHPTTLSNLNEDKKTLYECSNEDCTLLTSSNWDIPSTDNASTHCGSYEVNSDRLLSDSYSTSSGYLSSSAENSSFMYTMYRWLWSKSLNILFGFLGFFFTIIWSVMFICKARYRSLFASQLCNSSMRQGVLHWNVIFSYLF